MSSKSSKKGGNPIIPHEIPESVTSKKAHGTCDKPVQDNLRWTVDRAKADKICCFNRHFAEHGGYFKTTEFYDVLKKKIDEKETEPMTFYDSVTGKSLFIAPKERSYSEFLQESIDHGWPSFRDPEVVWDNVGVLKNGETCSKDGTHLGHNLPHNGRNRYCINLVSVAGNKV